MATYAYNALGQRVYKGLPSTGRCPRDGEDRDHRARHDHDQASDRDDVHRDQGCRERDAHSAHWGWPFEGHDETHTGSRLFDYSQWRLLGEYNTDGRPVEETIWLGNRPVATVRDHRLYYIHTDHLGTPRVITEPGSGRVVWQWRSGPFGTGQPNEDPSGTGRKFVYNLRFAGQYYDSETGTAYNGFRDYDPGLGRYVESDPIGLFGGLNTYAYVFDDPISGIDPYAWWRLPDYLSANINIAIPTPFTGTIVGWSGTVSLDRYGDWFWSPIGGGIGKSVTVASFGATANWLNQSCKPSKRQLNSFLSGSGFNGAGGFWAGATESYTPGAGFATGVGFITPQLGVSYNYSFKGGNIGLGW